MEPAPTQTPTPPTVTIPATHLAALEAEIASLKARLAKRMNNNLERLKAYTDAHPDRKREATKRWKDEHREAYNARRRELRRLKKAGEGTTAVVAPPENPGTE